MSEQVQNTIETLAAKLDELQEECARLHGENSELRRRIEALGAETSDRGPTTAGSPMTAGSPVTAGSPIRGQDNGTFYDAAWFRLRDPRERG
jgi:hypothetical protein